MDNNSVALEESRIVPGLTDIQPAAQHQQQIAVRKRMVGPTVCVAADHSDAKRIVIWHHVYG